MLRVDIAGSDELAALSKDSVILYFYIRPQLNPHGKLNGNPHYIKGQVCPKLDYLTPKKITACLREISEKTALKWFEHDGLMFLHDTKWTESQDLRADRSGPDALPSYQCQENSGSIPGSVQENSGSTPVALPLEVEEEVEVKGVSGRKKREGKSTPAACPSLDVVTAYFVSKNFDPLEAENFYDFYQSNGWYVGKRPMKDWEASARNWIRRAPEFGGNKRGIRPEKKASRNYLSADAVIAKQRAEEDAGAVKAKAQS